MLIGSTWAMATAGKKASSAVGPAAAMPRARAAMTAAPDQDELVGEADGDARWPPGAGAGRSWSRPRLTAARKRRHPFSASTSP